MPSGDRALERLRAFARQFRENARAARQANRQRLFPLLVEDCEKLAEARRKLANDSQRVAVADEFIRHLRLVAKQDSTSPAE